MNNTGFSPLLLPYANGEPVVTGVIRETPEDFFVEELLGFEPAGEGEHIFLWIEKTDLNTDQVARMLAEKAGVPAHQVSYSGMKDRRAVTRQWFSVHLPGKGDVEWDGLQSGQLKILRQQRHLKKLRRGAHRANRFVLRVTDISGEMAALPARVDRICREGVPNYFGEQRFGRNGNNLREVRRWFAGAFKPRRHQRGIYLSAARAFLFNAALARRVADGSWRRAMPGELLMLAGNHSLFRLLEDQRNDIAGRLEKGDVHPTGPLYGRPGKLMPADQALVLETRVMGDFADLAQGLEGEKAMADRRALRVIPEQVDYRFAEGAITLSFTLSRGCFATAVVRELLHYRVVSGAGALTDPGYNNNDTRAVRE